MERASRQVIMLASENDALINGKIGGLADVIRDLPNALADLGYESTIITPAYGFLQHDNPSSFLTSVVFPFGGTTIEGGIWEVTPKDPRRNVRHLVFEHPEIRGTPIYSQDPPGEPFASDGTKFALFCSAIGQYLKGSPPSSVIHLHDWHMGSFFLLRELHPGFDHLKKHKCVFTIHNLGYQGNRPIHASKASVEKWFPELFNDVSWIGRWKDHRYAEPQFTPLAAGIRFADHVNTVSPRYAEEILKPSDHENGFYGGEGLERLLQEAKAENRLDGILNGTEYPPPLGGRSHSMLFSELCDLSIAETKKEIRNHPDPFYDLMIERIDRIRRTRPAILLTSVTRVTEQKVRLLFERGSDGKPAIENILDMLRRMNGFYLLLGNGTEEYEDKCEKVFGRHERLIYLKLYSSPIAQALYGNGTIFLMPSSFEPCGISQMIAMRNGQPCIVHAVGGLKDTVTDHVNGFHFNGTTIEEQVDNFVRVTEQAADIYLNRKPRWETIQSEAARARFDWSGSARKYIDRMYQ